MCIKGTVFLFTLGPLYNMNLLWPHNCSEGLEKGGHCLECAQNKAQQINKEQQIPLIPRDKLFLSINWLWWQIEGGCKLCHMPPLFPLPLNLHGLWLLWPKEYGRSRAAVRTRNFCLGLWDLSHHVNGPIILTARSCGDALRHMKREGVQVTSAVPTKAPHVYVKLLDAPGQPSSRVNTTEWLQPLPRGTDQWLN